MARALAGGRTNVAILKSNALLVNVDRAVNIHFQGSCANIYLATEATKWHSGLVNVVIL